MSLFNNLNSNQNKGRIEENTELRELDEFGKPKEKKTIKNKNTNIKTNFKNKIQNNKGKVLISGLCIFCIFFFFYYSGTLDDLIDMFSATPEENLNAMFQEMRDMEKINKQNGKVHPIYDHNNIYSNDALFKQVEKEYVVYLYTEDSVLDEPFNSWILNNQDRIPIYKLNYYSIIDPDLENIIPHNSPSFLIIREIDKGYKIVDSVIEKESEFDNIPIIIQTLKDYRQSKNKGVSK